MAVSEAKGQSIGWRICNGRTSHEPYSIEDGLQSGVARCREEGEQMPLFLCRWLNGDCSVVWARNKEDAIVELDQVGNPEGCPITQVQTLQVTFHTDPRN